MRVLVTGGAGYIGSITVRHLLKAGHEVVVHDSLERGKARPDGAEFLIGNLRDACPSDIFYRHRIEAVIHFAAYALVGESVQSPQSYYVNNVIGSLKLLEAMRACNVHMLVFSSSTAVYGNPGVELIAEDMPKRPTNPYGTSKLMCELLMEREAMFPYFRYAALRYFNAAGAALDGSLGECHDPETHLVPIVLQTALGQREKVTIHGGDYPTPDGTCIRDYVHVEDLARAHVMALEALEWNAPSKREQLQAINLGSGRGTSVLEIIEACRRITGRDIPVEIGPRREGDPPKLVADISRAKEVLGWEPQHSDLDTIVETAWKWHSTHAPLRER